MQTIQQITDQYKNEFQSPEVIKKMIYAHQSLWELKWVTHSLPNRGILLNTLSLQEAKDSSAIENIVTTQDELYQSNVTRKKYASMAAKEVYSYVDALQYGYESIQDSWLLTNQVIIKMQWIIEGNDAGVRRQWGTSLKNEETQEIIYTPPQTYDQIMNHMTQLATFINTEESELDSLLKLAIIHHQFESIHPFYDGNWRTWRIINVLYLVKQWLLESPILYLSRYINQHKQKYYRLLQDVRDHGVWAEWCVFMLQWIAETSIHTTQTIKEIKNLTLSHKHTIREKLPKIYSQDLINNIFKHPYTKIEFLSADLWCTRITAAKYLNVLASAEIGILQKEKIWRENYYINKRLFGLLMNV